MSDDISSISVSIGDGLATINISAMLRHDSERNLANSGFCRNLLILNRFEEISGDHPIIILRHPREDKPRLILLEEITYDISISWSESVMAEQRDSLPYLKHANGIVIRTNTQVKDLFNINFRSYVGKGFLDVTIDGETYGLMFEVRSRKIDYVRSYDMMLHDVAEFSCSALMDPSSPLFQDFALSEEGKTLYDRFLVLDYLFHKADVASAIRAIRSNPHRNICRENVMAPTWRATSVDPSRLVDMISPENILGMSNGPILGRFAPLNVPLADSYIEYDVPENRLVREFVESSLNLSRRLLESNKKEGARSDYVHDSLLSIISECEDILSDDWFLDIGVLGIVPLDSMVLHRRDDYRCIMEAYCLLSAGAMHDTEVPGLLEGHNLLLHRVYEYWCYIQLFRALNDMSEKHRSVPISKIDGAWTVSIRDAEPVEFDLSKVADGCKARLYYMRKSDEDPSSDLFAYSVPLYPDYTIIIESPDSDGKTKSNIINLDAKYKSKPIEDIDESENKNTPTIGFRTDDLFKMHTYRDAFVRSYGSYILYPGNEIKFYKRCDMGNNMEYSVPSVGAIPLNPCDPDRLGKLETILSSIIETVFRIHNGQLIIDETYGETTYEDG